jgi:hypothetical protein
VCACCLRRDAAVAPELLDKPTGVSLFTRPAYVAASVSAVAGVADLHHSSIACARRSQPQTSTTWAFGGATFRGQEMAFSLPTFLEPEFLPLHEEGDDEGGKGESRKQRAV